MRYSASMRYTVYPKKYAHGFCLAVLCCGYTLTDFPISIRLTSLALWQSNDCPSASKATLMNMDKYFMWIHYERLHNHNKAKHNKTVCIFLGIYCTSVLTFVEGSDCGHRQNGYFCWHFVRQDSLDCRVQMRMDVGYVILVARLELLCWNPIISCMSLQRHEQSKPISGITITGG